MVSLTIPSNCSYLAVLHNGRLISFPDSRSAERYVLGINLEVVNTDNDDGWFTITVKKADSHI